MIIPGSGGFTPPQHIKTQSGSATRAALPLAEDPRFKLTPELLKNAQSPEVNLAAL